MTHEQLIAAMADLEKQLENATTAEEIVKIADEILALHDANPVGGLNGEIHERG